jgi:hypothetical protein
MSFRDNRHYMLPVGGGELLISGTRSHQIGRVCPETAESILFAGAANRPFLSANGAGAGPLVCA